MSQTQALYRLQKLDLENDSKRKRAHEIIAILDQDSVLRKAKDAVDAVNSQLHPKESRAKDLNLEIQTVTDQSKQLSQRLYGNTVSNPKELEDIQNKIAERKRRREQLENDLLEVMIEVEDLQSQLAEATEQYQAVKAERASEHAQLKAELKTLKADIVELKTARKTAASDISKQNRVLYKELRTRKQGQPVAKLMGDSCAVCGVRQTTTLAQQVRQDQEIIFCSSCGRILVAF